MVRTGKGDASPRAAGAAAALLVVEDVRKSYAMGKATVDALRGVSFTIREGEFLAIMGPSGCGKTTLLNIIGGIDTPTAGSVVIRGTATTGLRDRELTRLRLREIGFIFQQFYLIPTLSALENVELPMREAGVPAQARQKRAEDLLKRVGLGHRLGHFPSELSGGEQQRVAIARALSNRPRLVLADEPTGELDSENSARIMALLRELNRQEGVAFVLVTHDAGVADSTDRIIRVRDGKILEDTPAPGRTAAS